MTQFPPVRIDTANLPQVLNYLHRAIGADHMLSMMQETAPPSTNYPPYNLTRIGEDTYEIVMAVAGFTRDEVSVTMLDRTLTIQGEKNHDELPEDAQVLHRGLGLRVFTREF